MTRFRRRCTLPIACAVALAAGFAPGAFAQSVFGSPVVKPDPASAGKDVLGTKVVPKLKAVTDTERALASLTASQASGAAIVTLNYSPHKVFDIPVRVGMFTTLSLPKDEPIKQFAVSTPAAVKLNVDASTNTAMLKLVQGMTVTGTIVTDKHVFYISISPATDTQTWYQGVDWSFDADTFGQSSFEGGVYNAKASAGDTIGDMTASTGGDVTHGLYSGQPNFDYTIKGDAPFKPVAVWDNGRFTWVQFPKNLQALPALFVDGPNGLEIVNYTVHADGTQLLVNRLMPRFVLRLGKAEIAVEAHH